jgi:hypothetical protein
MRSRGQELRGLHKPSPSAQGLPGAGAGLGGGVPGHKLWMARGGGAGLPQAPWSPGPIGFRRRVDPRRCLSSWLPRGLAAPDGAGGGRGGGGSVTPSSGARRLRSGGPGLAGGPTLQPDAGL